MPFDLISLVVLLPFLLCASVFMFLPIGKEVKCDLQGVRFDLGQRFFNPHAETADITCYCKELKGELNILIANADLSGARCTAVYLRDYNIR